MRDLVLATHNPDKIREIKDLLHGLPLRLHHADELRLPSPEETGLTLQENAILKAVHAARISGMPSVADDTGLMVDALGGMPGVFSARFAGPDATYADNRRKLLEHLSGIQHRNARFLTCVALVYPDGTTRVFWGKVEGWITQKERGTSGFGYDPVFLYPPMGVTFGELPLWVKNRISHRFRAFSLLRHHLEAHGLFT